MNYPQPESHAMGILSSDCLPTWNVLLLTRPSRLLFQVGPGPWRPGPVPVHCSDDDVRSLRPCAQLSLLT
eukprot:709020-Rhodomonas_salina.4